MWSARNLRAAEDAGWRYARRLLDSLGVAPAHRIQVDQDDPALGWARSGMMVLTGLAEGEPQMCPAPITACADGALAALASLAPDGALKDLRGSDLLTERARVSGFTRRGAVSPGGGCYLLDTTDGAIAVSLARDDDWLLVPAWLETEGEATWESVRRAVAPRTMHDLVERGRLLGLAVAPNVPVPGRAVEWCSHSPLSPAPLPRGKRGSPVVVDLSSLWAGPLCSRLLQKCGARVIKVESVQRPDGARRGPAAFFDLMNAGKESVSLDFSTEQGRSKLRELIAQADVVIEGSRPRALRQLGIDAESLVKEHQLTWISITGYGRGEPQENWIAYGDDAGVAAGLSHLMQRATGLRLICGDAIADPLTGMHAALAAWWSYRRGGGRLISLSLVDVVRHCLQFDRH